MGFASHISRWSTLVSLGVQFKADLYGIPLEQMQRRLAGMKYTHGEAEILIIEGIIWMDFNISYIFCCGASKIFEFLELSLILCYTFEHSFF